MPPKSNQKSSRKKSRKKNLTDSSSLNSVSSFESDDYFSKSDLYDSEGEEKMPKLYFFCKNTNYEIIKLVGKHLLWHNTKREKSDWDISWFDAPLPDKFLQKMMPW